MTTYFLDIKNGKDTNSGLDWDQAFLTHERLWEELDKNAKSVELTVTMKPTIRYDFPTPKNFENPMGEKK